MTNGIHIIDPRNSDEWMQFILRHPDASIFHHPAWMNMLRDIYHYPIFAVCIIEGNAIQGGIPFADVRSLITGKRWISLPFSDYCKPLLPSNPALVEALVQFLVEKQKQETPRIEVRWALETAQRVHFERTFVTHTTALDKEELALFASFDKQGAQRSVRIAEREGVVVRECKSFEDFQVFYRLQVMTRHRLGVPAQPKSFFKGVWDYLISQGLGYVLIAFKDATPLAGGVFFQFKDTVWYKYSASDMTYKGLHPNHAFIWKGIRRALAEGYSTFDFGRSEKSNEGLRRFKRGWASTEHELAYTIFADQAPNAGPSGLSKLIEPVIRRAPEFVCKLSGELLYKHFA
jgi:CelD/BcsL family acetyltransferase involved in cellulose biosynthesis